MDRIANRNGERFERIDVERYNSREARIAETNVHSCHLLQAAPWNQVENIMRSGRFRLRIMWSSLIVGALASVAQLAYAESEYAAAWGPSVGTMEPLLAADDQHGKRQTLDSLKGTNGLLFVFNRSVDW